MNCLLFLIAVRMFWLLVESSLVSVATAQGNTCTDGQVYAKITKITKSWASDESFKIFDGATELYTSPSLENNAERVLEICLPTNTYNLYTLQMNDSSKDSWGTGAWISIEGVNGNLVLKYMMTDSTTETVNFSLYAPINKNSTWKYSATGAAGWNTASFADQEWTDVVTGSEDAPSVVGTQYFRHAFIGAPDFAAVEVQMLYRYGAIAYINGEEIYRDNMPEGAVTQDTIAAGSYTIASYHGVLRPANVAEQATSVLAVELHFLNVEQSNVIQFNGFLSIHAGISAENKCMVLNHDPSITSSGFTNADNAFNWSRSTRAYASESGSFITGDYSTAISHANVNAIRVWPYTSPTSTVNTFTVSGANLISGEYTELFSVSNTIYTSGVWKQWIRVTPADYYPYLRVTIENNMGYSIGFYAFQYLVCNLPAPTTIPYTQTKTSFYRGYEPVELSPDNYGYSNCQITPALPAGINWDSASCSLAGTPTEARAQTTYTVTTTIGTVQATGTFTLTIEDCAHSMYRMLRTYKSSPQNEYFRIYDTATSTVIYEVQQGHAHTASMNWVEYICISQERFDVTYYHTGNYWMSGSYFYLYYTMPNGEEELVLRGRFDANENVSSNQFLRRPAVEHSQQWYYKFDSVPANWHSSDVAGWSQAARGSFPTATNKIQLYKKTFNVNNMSEVMGYILSIRYKYGAIVYLNGHEAWRNGVTGEVTGTPAAENMYNDLKYHVVTLPGKTMVTDAEPTVKTFLQQGANTIAIALVAIADTQTSADFDCIVRLMAGDSSESHIWEMTGSVENMNGTPDYVFSHYYGNSVYYNYATPCTTNYMQITLNNDRREWISSMHIQNYYTTPGVYEHPAQFKVYARNNDSEEWTLLKEVTGLTWSMTAQKRRIYFQNNMPYNQFRFENIFPANHATQCKWRVQSFDLYADNTFAELAPLTYESNVEIFKDIEMAEFIPTGEGYFDYTIAPALPTGVKIDPHTGWISGTASVIADPATYTVTAKKVTGGTTTATFSLTIIVCTGDYSLMTVRFHTDNYVNENSWKLYQGRGTTGTVLQHVDQFPVANAYYYVDFCLDNGLYTLEGHDNYGDGWLVNNGYTLTADVGKLEIDMAELPAGTMDGSSVFTTFSSYFPFQVEYTEWKVSQNGYVEGWNTIAFDDNNWSAMKANAIPTTEQITTYIRKTFTIANIADYQVLNVRLIYSGGVACYFNGNMVGLFNMAEGFDDLTESLTVHDSSIDAKFHIILPTAGMVEGTNVIAFEVHRPAGASSSEPVVFDATGVFGVEDCSVVRDSYSELTNTEPSAGGINGILDLDPFTTGQLPNEVGTFIEWTVDNRLGSKWNAFNIYQGGPVSSWGFRIYGTMEPDTERPESTIIFQEADLAVDGRTRPNFQVPVALAGFRKYRWEVMDTASASVAMNAMFQVYCKATGATCPAVENYPSVGEGQISPSSCPEGYTGYSYRECADGQLSEVKLDKCTVRAPSNARYNKSRMQLVKNITFTTGVPSVRGIVTKWYIDTNVVLPEGLTLNEMTGEISGTPTKTQDMTSYTIFAENGAGVTSAVLDISVRVGQCLTDGVFPTTNVNEVAVYECSEHGAYVGTQKRACLLGAVDGEWQKASGICISIVAVVIVILSVIVVIAIVIFVFVRTTRKAKAVGGVKGKKAMKTTKITTPKKDGKAVKV